MSQLHKDLPLVSRWKLPDRKEPATTSLPVLGDTPRRSGVLFFALSHCGSSPWQKRAEGVKILYGLPIYNC